MNNNSMNFNNQSMENIKNLVDNGTVSERSYRPLSYLPANDCPCNVSCHDPAV